MEEHYRVRIRVENKLRKYDKADEERTQRRKRRKEIDK